MIKNWVKIAEQYIDCPAVGYSAIASDTPAGFRCSGFVKYVLEEAGFDLNRNPDGTTYRWVSEFMKFGHLIHYDHRRSGDLIISTKDGVHPSHIGILLSQTEAIHSPGKPGTIVEVVAIERFMKPIDYDPNSRFYQQYESNPIALRRPTIFIPGYRRERQVILENYV